MLERILTLLAVVVPAAVLVGCGEPSTPTPPALVAIVEASAPRDDLHAGFVCAGVLVAPRTVLSASHCFDASATPVDAVVGATNLCIGSPVTGYRRRVTRIHLSRGSDLATLALDHAVPRVAVPTARARPGMRVEQFGWGRPSRYGPLPCRPRVEPGVMIDSVKCRSIGRSMHRWRSDTQACVEPDSRAVAACSGDSGGPAFAAGNRVVVGVVSWSTGCHASSTTVLTIIGQ